MSFFRRHDNPDELDTDEENNDAIDPELRLRTVRTAASTIAESIRQEQRAERRKSMRKKSKGSFFRRNTEKRRQDSGDSDQPSSQPSIHGRRRNVYVNLPLPADEQDSHGEPVVRYARNKVRTSKYTIVTFIPRNLYEQFRR
uniref:Phospholipid-transporting ATPase (EC) n=1 Tax=Ganoderma boninense TaxID=34458 RepID=A0A5K1JYE8_9APHY|nr:Phospholipid-transporting ATPase (EC [Ganoderma boninense]